jgi:hypothetical protein
VVWRWVWRAARFWRTCSRASSSCHPTPLRWVPGKQGSARGSHAACQRRKALGPKLVSVGGVEGGSDRAAAAPHYPLVYACRAAAVCCRGCRSATKCACRMFGQRQRRWVELGARTLCITPGGGGGWRKLCPTPRPCHPEWLAGQHLALLHVSMHAWHAQHMACPQPCWTCPRVPHVGHVACSLGRFAVGANQGISQEGLAQACCRCCWRKCMCMW